MKIVKMMFSVIFLILLVRNVLGDVRTQRIVKTKMGMIRGFKADDGDYMKYLGIPYAKVNRSNPFGEALPTSDFNEIFDAKNDLQSCIHIDESNKKVGTINCLKLNINVPILSQESVSMPVLVYLHGGDFKTGNASQFYYGPKFLMNKNIIFVTLNYRIGIYGFLCPAIQDVPNNRGLKDQIIALKWIRDNIESFGGDSKRITLSGHGSGSICAHIHFLYGEEMLFNQVILASGTALAPSVIREPNNADLLQLAEAAGFRTIEPIQAFQFISKINPQKLIKYVSKLNLNYSPCTESYSEITNNLITEYPENIKIIDNGIKMLIGNTVNEGEYLSTDNISSEDLENLIINYLSNVYTLSDTRLHKLKYIIREFYVENENELKKAFIDFISDSKFHYPTKKTIEQYIESRPTIYFYEFVYKGDRNFMQQKLNKTSDVAIHGDDLGYLFDILDPAIFDKTINHMDKSMIRKLIKIWANFVKYGVPIPRLTKLLPVKWNPVTPKSLFYMVIDRNMTLGRRPYIERMSFWDLLNDLVMDRKEKFKNKDIEDDFRIEASGDFILA